VAFGVIQIVLGGLAALAIPFMLLSALLSRKAPGGAMPVGSYVASTVTWAVIAVAFVVLGIGSIRACRWAWALTLILSWVWLLMGVLVTILLTAVLPAAFLAGFRKAAEANPAAVGAAMPTGIIAVVLTFVIVFFAVFFIVVPIAFLLFYRRQDVEETCKRRDPVERWTDRCPLPVLAPSLLFACAVPYYLLMSVTTPLLPFFGKYLTGVPGGLGCIALAGIDAYLALSLFRLKAAGWWIAVAALMLRVVSAAITFRRANLFQAYAKLGWQSQQLEMLSQNPAVTAGLWWGLGFTLLFLGYLLWIKRYFSRPPVRNGMVSLASPGV